VSKESPHRPILLDFGLTKRLSSTIKQALAKMFLASAEVGSHFSAVHVYNTNIIYSLSSGYNFHFLVKVDFLGS